MKNKTKDLEKVKTKKQVIMKNKTKDLEKVNTKEYEIMKNKIQIYEDFQDFQDFQAFKRLKKLTHYDIAENYMEEENIYEVEKIYNEYISFCEDKKNAGISWVLHGTIDYMSDQLIEMYGG